jgi:hypothetical protein
MVQIAASVASMQILARAGEAQWHISKSYASNDVKELSSHNFRKRD